MPEGGDSTREVRSDAAHAASRAAGIPATVVGPELKLPNEPGDRMKGLEYRCVAVIDAGRDRLPQPWAVTPEADDPVQHRHDLQRERCLLYVACTRARDVLRVSWSGAPSPFLASLVEH